MQKFDAFNVAVELVRALNPIVETLRMRSAELADQIDRARMSIVLNISEGARRQGKDRRRFYVIAAGSASEVFGALAIADALGFNLDDRDARHLLDRECALLWRLTHDRNERAAAAPPR
jgi:four helix bundle protein